MGDCAVVLAMLQIVFLGKHDDQGLGPRGWPFSCVPDLAAVCCESSDCFFSTCWTCSVGMLSTPADFPSFNDCTAASTSLQRMGWLSSVSGAYSVLINLH